MLLRALRLHGPSPRKVLLQGDPVVDGRLFTCGDPSLVLGSVKQAGRFLKACSAGKGVLCDPSGPRGLDSS